jgi:hypothetical protein
MEPKTILAHAYIVTTLILLASPTLARSTTSRWCSFYGPKEFIRAQRTVADIDTSARAITLYWKDGIKTQLKFRNNSLWVDTAGKTWYASEEKGNPINLIPGRPDRGFKFMRQSDGAVIDCDGWPNSDI